MITREQEGQLYLNNRLIWEPLINDLDGLIKSTIKMADLDAYFKRNSEQILKVILDDKYDDVDEILALFKHGCNEMRVAALLCLYHPKFSEAWKKCDGLLHDYLWSGFFEVNRVLMSSDYKRSIKSCDVFAAYFIKTFLEIIPDSINGIDLEYFRIMFDKAYVFHMKDYQLFKKDSKKNKDKSCFYNYEIYLDNEMEIKNEALFLICSHPLYGNFEYSMFESLSGDASRKYFEVPFYTSAICGNQKLFTFFYAGKQSSDDTKLNAVIAAKSHDKTYLLEDASWYVVARKYENELLTFYIGMLSHDFMPKEIAILILSSFINAEQDICFDHIEKYSLPPLTYKYNCLEIIKKILTCIDQYSSHKKKYFSENNYQTDYIDKGVHRANCIKSILNNRCLTLGFKFMAVHAVLNERTYRESAIQACLIKGLMDHVEEIADIAADYASKKNINIIDLESNLLNLIHGQIYSFESATEDELLDALKPAESLVNRLKFWS